jgi:membrane protease YdiL (CAAX protease family)
MEYSPLPVEISRKSWVDRLQAAFEILLLSGLISGFLAALVLPLFHIRNTELLLKDIRVLSIYLLVESGIALLILAAVLKLHGETFHGLGFRWKHWKRNFLIGLVLVPFLFLINAIVAILFKVYLPEYYIEKNPLVENLHTPQQLALFIFSALIAGGIKEEIQRAFIINRFRGYLGGAGTGLLIWSLAFGAGHYVQGAQGIVIASLYGFFFGGIYLLSGSLIAPIAAHGAYDALAILVYYFFSDKIK